MLVSRAVAYSSPVATGMLQPKVAGAWILGAGLAGVALRAYPLVARAVWDSPVDYDEGVYFTAAALWNRGVVPYRDFFFVHPPGLLIFVRGLIASCATLAGGMLVAKAAAVVLGALNLGLVAWLARSVSGLGAAALAVGLYAFHPQAVDAEHGVFLEPLLSALCLGAAALAIGERGDRVGPRTVGAGVLVGVGAVVKLWAAAWLLGLLFLVPGWKRRLGLLGIAVGVAVVAYLACGAAFGPAFAEGVFAFHRARPPDGQLGFSTRLFSTLGLGVRGSAWLAVPWAFAALASRHAKPASKGFAVAWALGFTAFLASPSYWPQYNAFLAPLEAILGGVAGVTLIEAVHARFRVPRGVTAGVVAAVALLGLRPIVRAVTESDPLRLQVQSHVAGLLTEKSQLFAFDPADALCQERLPEHRDDGPVVVDVYALMLRDALKSGARYSSAAEAFLSDASQSSARARLERSDVVMMLGRGSHQLNANSRLLLRNDFEPTPFEVWKRKEPSGAGRVQ